VRQSNTYIIIYSAVLTVVCGGLLAFASESLKERQQANVDMEQKYNILSTVIQIPEGANVDELYSKRVRAFVINYEGDVQKDKEPKDINIAAEYKKPSKDRLLPVYEFVSESDSTKVTNVVLPDSG
jgi:Na+-transporting NADH:ubiquinone oxidoreductase subunit C